MSDLQTLRSLGPDAHEAHKARSDIAAEKPKQLNLDVLATMADASNDKEVVARDVDDNKICQWYCCSCGQSYGTIIYKSNIHEEECEGEGCEKNRETDTTISNIKYYSSQIYNNSSNLKIHDSNLFSPLFSGEPDFYFSNNISRSKSWSIGNLDYSSKRTQSAPSSPALDYKDVTICEPARFTCHRCKHMMCPYCLKIRLKDLMKK